MSGTDTEYKEGKAMLSETTWLWMVGGREERGGGVKVKKLDIVHDED